MPRTRAPHPLRSRVTQPCHSDTSGMLCAHQRAAVLDASELNVPVTVRGLSS